MECATSFRMTFVDSGSVSSFSVVSVSFVSLVSVFGVEVSESFSLDEHASRVVSARAITRAAASKRFFIHILL